jgi:MoxR-like ATPase
VNETVQQLNALVADARRETSKVIIGQHRVVDQALIAILTGQHALIEGVPGIAKTMLVRTLAHVLGCEFARIQFTPDLMPSDITGASVFNMKEGDFKLVPGPVFTSFLLADEINRAPAKTQAALLQAMQERLVSIDRQTYSLDANFTVFATQNPIEFEGTYPLPEAQKDRFMLKIVMDYPELDDELMLAEKMLGQESPQAALDRGVCQKIFSAEQLAAARSWLQSITMRMELVRYIVEIVRATRSHESVLVGAGPRATQSLILASRATATLAGRDYVTPDDIREMALPVLGHRLVLRPEFEIEGLRIEEVAESIMRKVAVPV